MVSMPPLCASVTSPPELSAIENCKANATGGRKRTRGHLSRCLLQETQSHTETTSFTRPRHSELLPAWHAIASATVPHLLLSQSCGNLRPFVSVISRKAKCPPWNRESFGESEAMMGASGRGEDDGRRAETVADVPRANLPGNSRVDDPAGNPGRRALPEGTQATGDSGDPTTRWGQWRDRGTCPPEVTRRATRLPGQNPPPGRGGSTPRCPSAHAPIRRVRWPRARPLSTGR